MSTTPTLRDAAQASPCPFCGGDSTAPSHSQHRPGCYFLVLASVKAAPQGDLSWAPELLAAWNRRAALTQGAGEAVEPVATVVSWTNSSYSRNYKLTWHKDVPEGTKLHAATQLQQAVARALAERDQRDREQQQNADARAESGAVIQQACEAAIRAKGTHQ